MIRLPSVAGHAISGQHLQAAARCVDLEPVDHARDSSDARLDGLRLCARLLTIIVAVYAAVEWSLEATLADLTRLQELGIEAIVLTCITGALLWVLVLQPLRRTAEAERLATAEREAQLRAEGQRQDFDARLHRALEMATTEEASYGIVRRTLDRAVAQFPAELLLADSSDAHLKQAVETGPDGNGPGCTVDTPHACPAIRRGQTLTFASSEELDACPFLQDRPYGACAATCVPVNVAGRSIGVLHAIAPPEQPIGREQTVRLEALATQGGARIGMLRVMERTSLQAATDPLTGLLNRRTLENRVYELLQRGESFAIAMGDLDHFKLLNDTHGHDAGDRALRLFARTLRSSVRGEDLVCRFGGEEFVVVLPRRSAAEAGDALRRIQEELLVAINLANLPPFTASYGVTDSHQAGTLEELLRVADLNLFQAKREGRNRIVLDNPILPETVPATKGDDGNGATAND
jgi:diguanylate cyclase (GGDEF)-like protein